MEIYITPGKFGICTDELVVCEYYNRKVITKVKPGDTVSVGVLKSHASTIIKIERVAGDPIVVESNGYLSMGKEREVLEIVENELRIAGRNKFDYPVEYVVMVPGCYFIDKEAGRIRFKMAGLECFDKKVNLRE